MRWLTAHSFQRLKQLASFAGRPVPDSRCAGMFLFMTRLLMRCATDIGSAKDANRKRYKSN